MAKEEQFSLGDDFLFDGDEQNIEFEDEYTDFSNDEEDEDNEEQDEEYEEEGTEDSEESYEDEDSEQDDEEFEDSEEEQIEDELVYSPFVEHLIDEDVLFPIEDKEYEDSPEGFRELIQDTATHMYESLIGSLPEEAQRLIEIAKAGGDLREALDVYDAFDYSQVDLEDEDVRRNLITDYYKEVFPNLDEKRLAKKVDILFELTDDEDEAKEAQEFFIAKTEKDKETYYESIKEQEKADYERQQAEIAQYNELISNVNGFKGLSFKSAQDKETFRAYCFDRGKDGKTQLEKDTMSPEERLAQAFFSYKKFNFDAVQRKAETKVTLAQKKALSRFQDKNASSGKSEGRRHTRPNDGTFSLGEIM